MVVLKWKVVISLKIEQIMTIQESKVKMLILWSNLVASYDQKHFDKTLQIKILLVI